MARPQTKPNLGRKRGQLPVSKSLQNQEKRCHGAIRKQLLVPVHRNARLAQKERPRRRLDRREYLPPLPSPSTINNHIHKSSHDPSALAKPSKSDRKRKHSDQAEAEHLFSANENELCIKRPRTSPAAGDSNINSVRHWIQEGSWPKEYFEQGGDMSQALGKRSASSQLKSDWSNTTPREGKNPAAQDRMYEDILEAAGIFMHNNGKVTPTDACVTLCKALLDTAQPVPKDSLFRDDRFQETCFRLCNANEAKVIRDISPLIVPSGETLHEFGVEQLGHLTDHVNEKWYGCVPIIPPAPQPDFSIGFKKSAFSQSQLEKLGPFIKGCKYTPFLATTSIYFPFLTCEVKCGNEALNIADRQNAHNGSVAVKQLVNLYREVSRESELDRKILAFSVSHDHNALRIYGHYALIDGSGARFYRHPIRKFDFTEQDGRDKWTAYKFVLNVYKMFVPTHLERIRTAIDQMPGPVPQPSQQPRGESASQLVLNDSQSTPSLSRDTVPNTSSSQTSGPSLKKRKSKSTVPNTPSSQTSGPSFKKPTRRSPRVSVVEDSNQML